MDQEPDKVRDDLEEKIFMSNLYTKTLNEVIDIERDTQLIARGEGKKASV